MAQIFKAKTLVASSGRFTYEVSVPNLISNTGNFQELFANNLVYNTSDQTISGTKTFDVLPIVSGNRLITGVDLSSYATAINLFDTGSLLDNKINALSGYVSGISAGGTLPNSIVYTTGDQLISGNKTFLNNVNISGTGNFNNVKVSNIDKLFLSGIDIVITGNSSINVYNAIYISGNPVLTGIIPTSQTISNVVYTTGNQTISGIKTFANNLEVQGTGIFNALDLSNISEFNFSGTNINLVNGNVNISGGTLYISGNPVLTGVLPTTQSISNVVYTTGNQTIFGVKTFANTGSFDTLQITNKKLSSYNYVDSNFTFGNAYINIANSSNNITGTLPSEITSGINYYVKNLNIGILLITGSGQRTIDGFSTINLYKNESLQLIGVNNVGYTGWVSLSTDIGVS
jgi:hypothetical protein